MGAKAKQMLILLNKRRQTYTGGVVKEKKVLATFAASCQSDAVYESACPHLSKEKENLAVQVLYLPSQQHNPEACILSYIHPEIL